MGKIKTIYDINISDCTGCYGCMNVCPQSAITMQTDIRGFVHPHINNSICIHCGICYKYCPAIKDPVPESSFEIKAFSLSASPDVCLKSTSGGVFTVLANSIIDKGGIVFGAQSNGLSEVWHTYVTSKDKLDILRRSKYFQSNIGYSYRKIKDFLKANHKVLFVGTPCQVGALKNYLRKDYPNLLTCDLVCHGVPSVKVFEKFKYEREKQTGIEIVAYYRDSSQWAPGIFSTEYIRSPYNHQYSSSKNKLETFKEINPYNKDLFNLLFHSNIIQRRSCQHCKFCKLPRMGEITIGDDWIYYNDHINEPEKLKLGRSYIMINNAKGLNYFSTVKKDFAEIVEVKYIGGQHITIPPKSNPLSSLFFLHIRYKSILSVLHGYTDNKYFIIKCLLRVLKVRNKVNHRLKNLLIK